MQWVEANGASLRCEVSGAGRETVVLIHELGGSLDSWDLTLPAFQDRFRVLRYDLRGFGMSEKTKGALSIDILNADLVALLDALGIAGPCHVVGIALGGGIGLGYAIAHPERVRRLVVTSPAIGRPTAELRERLLSRAELVEKEGMRAVVDVSLNRSFPEDIRRAVVRFPAYWQRWLTNDPNGFAAINRMLAEMNLQPDLHRVACPTLVIGGEKDSILPPSVIEPIAAAIPGAVYQELDTGHFMHVQTPELFLDSVLPFLSA
ncbi:MAG: alpha/beta fold hydrolase [Proteobacteria bacterium]|nr:alpha/beta fold hydrolase [Pseudomonadota bacterium]